MTTLTSKFKKIKFNTHENVGFGEIELPEVSMHTSSYWWEFPSATAETLFSSEAELGDALKALSNVLQHVTALLIMCDVGDIRSVPMVRSPFSQKPTIYIYDNHPGGVGFSRKIFFLHDDLRAAAKGLILGCKCEYGCPSCVGPELEVGEGGKEGAIRLLEF